MFLWEPQVILYTVVLWKNTSFYVFFPVVARQGSHILDGITDLLTKFSFEMIDVVMKPDGQLISAPHLNGDSVCFRMRLYVNS